MIINNENKKLSRNRKRRVDCRNKLNDDIKLLSKKVKSEKKKILETMKKLNN